MTNLFISCLTFTKHHGLVLAIKTAREAGYGCGHLLINLVTFSGRCLTGHTLPKERCVVIPFTCRGHTRALVRHHPNLDNGFITTKSSYYTNYSIVAIIVTADQMISVKCNAIRIITMQRTKPLVMCANKMHAADQEKQENPLTSSPDL